MQGEKDGDRDLGTEKYRDRDRRRGTVGHAGREGWGQGQVQG